MTSDASVRAGGLASLARMPDALADLSSRPSLMRAFRRCIPELATGQLALTDVEPRRVRLRDGPCTATYDLTIGNGDCERRIRLQGLADPWGAFDLEMPEPTVPLGAPDWRCGVPELHLTLTSTPADTALTALSTLADPVTSRALLTDALQQHTAYRNVQVRWCEPTIARYKPGSRCTVVYRIGYDSGHAGPSRVIAKTYSGDKGRTAFDGMVGLWDSSLRSSVHVAVAEPLAFFDDLNVLVQGPVAGLETMKECLKRGLATGDLGIIGQALRRTARGLATLHGCGVRAASVTVRQERDEVQHRAVRLSRWAPEAGPRVSAWLSSLDGCAHAWPADEPVPSHGSFRPAQVLVDGDDVGFIDFDGFCEAEPAMDLALFIATVKNLGMRAAAPGEQVEHLCDGFVDEYRMHAPVTPERIALWEALFHVTNLLNCWAKVRPERIRGSLALLDRHIGLAGLPPI
ncbi:MAG TPA: phosphotransferase [Actinomycetota bacterium]